VSCECECKNAFNAFHFFHSRRLPSTWPFPLRAFAVLRWPDHRYLFYREDLMVLDDYETHAAITASGCGHLIEDYNRRVTLSGGFVGSTATHESVGSTDALRQPFLRTVSRV
jgi:hypothetical protein